MLVGKRIMVAVRSTLKLDVPIAMDSSLVVSKEYLSMLIKLSNEKMVENRQRTDRLLKALKQEFSKPGKVEISTHPTSHLVKSRDPRLDKLRESNRTLQAELTELNRQLNSFAT